jgi:bifunctional UDP-N-acetylglucosamine pyrophosphorylase/glucosamine-1-phosphate N-acetyltransferase
MSEQNIEICILAAGMGKRMHSTIPKAMQRLAGKPILAHLLQSAQALNPSQIHVVIGPEGNSIKSAFPEMTVNWVTQIDRRGTGHAVLQALPHFDSDSRVLILVGDAPLLSTKTMASLAAVEAPLSVLTATMEDPGGYGRIVKSESGLISEIVEHRDATDLQKQICEINTGVMASSAAHLHDWLPQLDDDNDQGELLLTDIVVLANQAELEVKAFLSKDLLEVTGINSFSQLAALESALQRRRAETLLASGVHIIDPDRFDLRGELECGTDVYIDINCVFEGKVSLGDGVRIGANCSIKDAVIAANSVIKENSVLDDCQVGPESQVGPFARLRPGTLLHSAVSIGNFVEVKNTEVGTGSKASHLTYLGDSVIGSEVNIGAGTITCNYDGVLKHTTRIEDHVFVGSNTAFVAPVTIGARSTIAAGSTITKDVDEGELAISRGKQKSVTNWKRPEGDK